MDVHPHLTKAPITEAILDLRVDGDVDLPAIEAFAKRVAATHPEAFPVYEVEAVFSVNSGKSGMAGSQSNVVGRICWNKEKTRAVQGKTTGFSVNHVKHYESWAVLRSEAHALWQEYLEVVKPRSITRLALRYINRLRLPAAGNLGSYMQTYPRLGPSLPQDMRTFFSRVEVPFTTNRLAIVTETAVPADPGAEERDLILDVDAVALKEFEAKDPEIWAELDQLRQIKNECFFGSLQERTWREYQ